MKFISIVLLAWMSIVNQTGRGLYTCNNVRIIFFSSAAMEDIQAGTSAGASVYNAATGELDFSVAIRSFQFDKSLMQEHFNSDYMESDRYPRAMFKGKIQERPDVTKDGAYPVNATGELTMHGVTQTRTVPGIITVKNGVVSMKSEFMVKCADHHIDIPRVVFRRIARSLKITVSATYSLYNNNVSK